MLIVLDSDATFLLSGTGDLIEPDDGIVGDRIGRAVRAGGRARRSRSNTDLDARAIAEKAMAIAGRHLHLHEHDTSSVEEL